VIFLTGLSLFACTNNTANKSSDSQSDRKDSLMDHPSAIDSLTTILSVDRAFRIADSLKIAGYYEEAITNYNLVDQSYVMMHDCNHLINNRMAQCLYLMDNEYSAKEQLKVFCQEKEPIQYIPELLAQSYMIIGQCYRWHMNFPVDKRIQIVDSYADSALFYLNEADRIYYSQNVGTERTILLHCKGEVFRSLRANYKEAELCYVEAHEIARSSQQTTTAIQLRLLYGLATVCTSKSDYEKAYIYGRRLLTLADSVGDVIFRYYAYSSLGNCSSRMGNLDLALSYLDSTIYIHQESINTVGPLLIFYNNKIKMLADKGLAKESIALSHKAIALVKNQGDQYSELSSTYLHQSMAYARQNEFDKAIKSCLTALEIAEKAYGLYHTRVSLIYNQLGKVQYSLDSLDSSILSFNKSLKSSIPGFNDKNSTNNPEMEQVLGNQDLIDALHYKALALLRKYVLEKKDKAYLRSSLECIKLADGLLDECWYSYFGEGSKLFLKENTFPIYELALEILYEINKDSPDRSLAIEALTLMEKNRYRLLLDGYLNEIAMVNSGVPAILIDSLHNIDYEIQLFHQRDHDKQVSTDSDDDIIFRLIQKKEDLLKHLGEDYPVSQHFRNVAGQLNYEDPANSIISADQGLIEYFFGRNSIFYVFLDDVSHGLVRVPISNQLIDKIDSFIAITSTPFSPIDSVLSTSNLIQTGHYLYKQLFHQPDSVFKHDGIDQVIILPDGNLSLISFESLISGDSDQDMASDQRFLINDFTISYGFSLNHLINQSKPVDLSSNNILGFGYGLTENHMSEYPSLGGSINEINTIKTLFKGSFFLGQNATELRFKRKVPHFGLVHLALHGKADTEMNDSTMLVFHETNDYREDGLLFPYELLQLDIQARLIVLSSCQSAIGKFYQGEGVFSMARAFALKGAQTIVSTLWPVQDQVAALLMEEFYHNLSNGLPVNRALQMAKLQLIQDPLIESIGPAAWSSFIVIGNTDSLALDSRPRKLAWLLGLTALLLAGIVFLSIRRKYLHH